MHRLVFFTLLATVCWAQQYRGDNSKNAAILSDSRYLSGDGTFGSAYKQEDGVEFHEESDQDGTRRGTYSYIDPNGQRRTVSYTAGKNGFQATGDHLPRAPVPAPVAPQQAPVNQYQPQPQYQPQQPQYQRQPQAYQSPAGYDDGSYRPEYDSINYQSRAAAPPAPVPTPAAPTNGQYSYSFGAPQPQQYQQQPQQYQQPQAAPVYTTTPAPHRFFPPGKLDLNRTPDGFSYTFNKS